MQRFSLVAVLALAACAQSPKLMPVFCTASAPYAGPELRVAPARLPTGGIDLARPMPQAVAEKLEARFRDGLEFNKAPVGAIAIYRGDLGYWSSTHGIAPGGSQRFALASITKMAIAAAIFQLADEKKLQLADTIDRWFPDLPNSRLVTVDNLLTHTSGLMSVELSAPGHREDLVRSFSWPSEEWVKYGGGNVFCPGARMEYSNHGYDLLARIAEQIDGAAFSDIVDRRIVKPLGLRNFGILRVGGENALVAPGEPTVSTWFDAKGKKRSATYLSVMAETGSGGGYGDTADMLAFLNAWLTGRLFPIADRDAALSHMLPRIPSVSHGRGIMMWEVPDAGTPATWLGHAGGMPGTNTLVIYDATRDAWLATAFNVHYADVNAVANEMLKALDAAAPHQP